MRKNTADSNVCLSTSQILRTPYDGCYVSDHAVPSSTFCLAAPCSCYGNSVATAEVHPPELPQETEPPTTVIPTTNYPVSEAPITPEQNVEEQSTPPSTAAPTTEYPKPEVEEPAPADLPPTDSSTNENETNSGYYPQETAVLEGEPPTTGSPAVTQPEEVPAITTDEELPTTGYPIEEEELKDDNDVYPEPTRPEEVQVSNHKPDTACKPANPALTAEKSTDAAPSTHSATKTSLKGAAPSSTVPIGALVVISATAFSVILLILGTFLHRRKVRQSLTSHNANNTEGSHMDTPPSNFVTTPTHGSCIYERNTIKHSIMLTPGESAAIL